jgi:protein-disulfide isomerase
MQMLKLLLLAAPCVFAEAPIPARLADVGWQVATPGAPLTIEIFGDFQCPDTKAAWNGWMADFRKNHASEVSIVFHSFPLPYHKNGFDASQAAMVMHSLAGGKQGSRSAPDVTFVRVADAMFAAQDKFQTDVTVNTTQTELFTNIFAPVAVSLGNDKAAFLEHMNNADKLNEQGRVAWKYGAARGVSGTPTFAANGVVSDTLASWTLSDWEAWLKAGSA